MQPENNGPQNTTPPSSEPPVQEVSYVTPADQNQATGPVPQQQFPVAPKKSHKKLFIIGGIVVLLLAILGGGGAYALWYMNPEKALGDAVNNSIKAKTSITEGTFTYKDTENDAEVTVKFDSKVDNAKFAGQLNASATIKSDDFNLDLKGSGLVAESGTVYVKLENALDLYEEVAASELGTSYLTPQLKSDLEKFIKKIDNKWIKIEKSDIEDISSEYNKQQECIKSAYETFLDDKKQQKQAFEAYDKNRFLELSDSDQSGSIDGVDSVAYNVRINITKSSAFGEALENTDFAKAILACNENSSSSDNKSTKMTDKEIADAQEEADKIKTTIWISRWGHEITKFKIDYKEDDKSVSFEAKTKANQKLDLKDPADTLSAKSLTKEFQEIINDAQKEYEDSYTSDYYDY